MMVMVVLGLPMKTLGLGLSWGTRPKFVMGGSIGLAHEDFGLGLELEPSPVRVDEGPYVNPSKIPCFNLILQIFV